MKKLLIMALCAAASLAYATNERETRGVHLVMPARQQLISAPVSILVPTPTVRELQLGEIMVPEPLLVTVASNTDWILTLTQPQPWVRQNTPQPTSALKIWWRLAGEANYKSLDQSADLVARSDDPADRQTYAIEMKIMTDLETTQPGTWDTSLVLTLKRAKL